MFQNRDFEVILFNKYIIMLSFNTQKTNPKIVGITKQNFKTFIQHYIKFEIWTEFIYTQSLLLIFENAHVEISPF